MARNEQSTVHRFKPENVPDTEAVFTPTFLDPLYPLRMDVYKHGRLDDAIPVKGVKPTDIAGMNAFAKKYFEEPL